MKLLRAILTVLIIATCQAFLYSQPIHQGDTVKLKVNTYNKLVWKSRNCDSLLITSNNLIESHMETQKLKDSIISTQKKRIKHDSLIKARMSNMLDTLNKVSIRQNKFIEQANKNSGVDFYRDPVFITTFFGFLVIIFAK